MKGTSSMGKNMDKESTKHRIMSTMAILVTIILIPMGLFLTKTGINFKGISRKERETGMGHTPGATGRTTKAHINMTKNKELGSISRLSRSIGRENGYWGSVKGWEN